MTTWEATPEMYPIFTYTLARDSDGELMTVSHFPERIVMSRSWFESPDDTRYPTSPYMRAGELVCFTVSNGEAVYRPVGVDERYVYAERQSMQMYDSLRTFPRREVRL